MKLKNGFLMLVCMSSLLGMKPAHAIMFPDEMPLTANGGSDSGDDENSDAVSRFGNDSGQKQQNRRETMKPLEPIAETSFAHEENRAPASVVENGGRSPAGGSAKVAKVRSSDIKRSKVAIVNQARREKAYQEVAVIANDNGFYPATVFLTQGIPVRMFITGASPKSQCFMLDQFGVRRQIRSQRIEEVTFVPDSVGTFSFNCPMNGAKGSVVVKELEVDGRVPASVSSPVTASAPIERHAPIEADHNTTKKSDINESDFTPEFRNN